jgi:Ca-activated chloride channel homolog
VLCQKSRVAALLLLSALLTLAQSEIPVFKSSTNLQSIAVQVTDKQGNPVGGLDASNFTLLENGRPQKIAFFGTGYQPVSLAVLIDSSSSMDVGGKLDQARILLGPLLRGNRPDDEILLMPFEDKVGPFERLTAEQRLRPPAIRTASVGSGGTALYDALASALCHMRAAENIRQAVVIITDGADQHSRLRLDQLIELARSSNAQIFTIGFYSKDEQEIYRQGYKTVALATGHEIDNPVIMFERLAKESGAESFFPSSAADFKKALDRISAVLQAQYTLAYYPQSVTGLRKIDVRVNRSGVKVSARHSVGSEEAEEVVHFSASGCEVSAKDHPYPWELRVTQTSGARTYHDDFSDPRSGWPNRRTDTHLPPGQQHESIISSHYVVGGYEISRSFSRTAPRERLANGVVAAYGPWWENFRASVLMEGGSWARPDQTADLSVSAAGMIFDVSATGYYELLLTIGENPAEKGGKAIAYMLARRVWYGPATPIVPWTFLSAASGVRAGAKAHKLVVECNREEIRALIDGVEVNRVRARSYGGGMVGFGVYGNGRTLVRDLLVEALE